MELPGQKPLVDHPPLAFRFGVFFFANGVQPNRDSSRFQKKAGLDTLFQKVSGIGASVDTMPLREGGQNIYLQKLPQAIQYENLVLERGLVVDSSLAIEVNEAMALFQFRPSNVLVSLLGAARVAVASWLFLNAYPVKWRVSDFNATANEVVIEHVELSYQRMQTIGL